MRFSILTSRLAPRAALARTPAPASDDEANVTTVMSESGESETSSDSSETYQCVPIMGVVTLALVWLAFACTSRPLAHDDEAGTTSAASSSEGSTTSETDASTTTDEGGLAFVPRSDGLSGSECDPFLQDCPAGEKCVAYSSFGTNYDANKCVPVLGDHAHGEPCTSSGLAEALDDCDATSFCFWLEPSERAWVGTCAAFCMGSADNPTCPPGSTCYLTGEGSITPCLPNCDPVAQDCSAGLGCFWANVMFSCMHSVGEIPTGEPCGYINDCAPGHLCADATMLPSCAGASCCTGYCNLPDGDAGCSDQPGTACMPFFTDETPPAEYAHVGVCMLPP